MLKIGDEDAVNILRFFDDLPDPRSEVNRLHRLGDVIVIAICAVIATADGPTAIANWAKLNERWLRKHLALPNGMPGKDTFRRVLGLLNPVAFQQCFKQWLQSLSPSVDGESEGKPHIAIDGKTMRRSCARRARRWACLAPRYTGVARLRRSRPRVPASRHGPRVADLPTTLGRYPRSRRFQA